MTDLVPHGEIERIVGTPRHATKHIARAVSATQTVFILHSRECLDSGIDLRRCRYSLALDRGIEADLWSRHCDAPVEIRIRDAHLVPIRTLPDGQVAIELGGDR
ncbi:hypothetical protein HOV42_gp70 [Gordonia phage Fairfaxidum]|uniref:Uncharacterized protein n=1 Tax=Gordonia phage Fairfaxidum TaxID=2572526 RepID=A0A4D6T7T0_9CAUD|nr:hypothetical protein HOV42_gp70 [Gordonia phage Fairfaxidum]QCG77653.1 hypothetical protein SEA_FAIRFAXIDUM_70 [Gordonia phage Fairfaxidum]